MDKKIYIKHDKGSPFTSVKDVIYALFRNGDGQRRSYAMVTYSDEACERAECFGGRRSFEDLLCLAKTYFPETTETELMDVMKELELTFYFCSDIHKIVFFYMGDFDLTNKSGLEHLTGGYRSYAAGTYKAEELLAIYESIN